ncbi:hypothetical protein [Pseudomonas fluorescens]|uniref:Uncharacterized protein n=1 Tax=Pseudomonas fluorescens TaxID=294 RepID=A0A5E7PUB2_PSEFL|nr:hypothetical protein [Pseudomonas fluorescens]VVP52999.1 hypothetical protein PS854_05453 [Pseudomonas fluorescens]
MIDSQNIKKISWGFFGFLVFFMVFGPSNLKYFWQAFFVMSLLAFMCTIYLVYVCEKITFYLTSILVAVAGAFSYLACTAAYVIGASFWGKTSIAALMLGLFPMGVTLLTYLVLANGKSSFHPFEYDGIKVQPRPQNKQKTSAAYSPLLVAGATTLAASIFTKSAGFLTTGMVALFGMLAVSVTFLFYARHIIRGLRTLRIQEKTMPTPYTFMQIDDIREARSRWWLSRLFKWFASWRKSPGV